MSSVLQFPSSKKRALNNIETTMRNPTEASAGSSGSSESSMPPPLLLVEDNEFEFVPTQQQQVNTYEPIMIDGAPQPLPGPLEISSTENGNMFSTFLEEAPWWAILSPLLLVICLRIGCCRYNHGTREGDRYGALLRQQAHQIWAQERVKADREGIPMAVRQQQIHQQIHTRTIVTQFENGYYQLGKVEEKEEDDDEEGVEDKEEFPRMASKGSKLDISMDTIDTVSSDDSEVVDDHEADAAGDDNGNDQHENCVVDLEAQECEEERRNTNAGNVVADGNEEENTAPQQQHAAARQHEDEEYICQICLEEFAVGDTVMFHSPASSSSCSAATSAAAVSSSQRCGHVFHHDCLMPWLLDQRENECPACRSIFIDDDSPPKNEEEDEIAVDLEKGGGGGVRPDCCRHSQPLRRHRENDETTYCIAHGRIIVMDEKHTNMNTSTCSTPSSLPSPRMEMESALALAPEEAIVASPSPSPLSSPNEAVHRDDKDGDIEASSWPRPQHDITRVTIQERTTNSESHNPVVAWNVKFVFL